MKKLLSLVLSAVMLISSFAFLPSVAHAEQFGNWTAIVNSSRTECHITGYTGNKNIAAVLIPSYLGGIPVTGVGMHINEFPQMNILAFCEDTVLEETPDCSGCSGLSKVEIIRQTSSGEELVSENILPSSIKKVSRGAFAGTRLKSLDMPGVELIGEEYSTGAFEDCDLLESVTIRKPAGIFSNTFSRIDSECTVRYYGPVSNWTGDIVSFSPRLKAVCDDGSFGWCGDSWDGTGHMYQRSDLYWKLTDDGTLTVDSVFTDDFANLQTVKTHSWNAFSVTSLNLNNVYDTGSETFRYTEIPVLELPSSVNRIGNYSFANCGKLTEVHIPKSVKTIGEYAFAFCSKLKDIYYDGTIEEWNAVTKNRNWDLSTPDKHIHVKCSVSFDSNGHGTSPKTQTGLVSYTDKAAEPEEPAENQWAFRGWYTEPACWYQWNFKDTVKEDMTLYAKWERVLFDINVEDSEGGTGSANRSDAPENTLIHLSYQPEDGWAFKCWEVETGNADVSHDTFTMPAEDVTLKPVFEKINNGINVLSGNHGTASADKQTATVGETVTLTATPDAGWKFSGWNVVHGDITISGNENASFTMSGDTYVTVRAEFERITYPLTVTVEGNGHVYSVPEGSRFPEGADVNLVPVADEGYRIKDMEILTEGAYFRYSYVLHMPGKPVEVKAVFEPIPVSGISTSVTGNGRIETDKNTAKSGETVRVTVIPDEGNRLAAINVLSCNTELWADENGYAFTMADEDVSILAEFEVIPPVYALSGDGVYFYDSEVSRITEAETGSLVTVSPVFEDIPEGYYFTNSYLSDGVAITVNETGDGEFAMPSRDVVIAPVLAERKDLDIDLKGTDEVVLPEDNLSGFITGSSYCFYDDESGMNYFDFNEDSAPDVWINRDNNSVFRGEGADLLGDSETVAVDSITNSKYRNVKFIFNVYYEVDARSGTGGTVSESGLYQRGAEASVTAAPDSGYIFDGWYINGTKVSSDLTYTIIVNSYTVLVAVFTEIPPSPEYCTLTVNAGPGGTAEGGAVLEKGAMAHVTAKPDSHYSFDGWYIDGIKCSGSADYSFAVTEDTVITAKFSEIPYIKTVYVKTIKGTYGEGFDILFVYVYDNHSKPMAGKTVTVTFNGKKYTLKTDSTGTYRAGLEVEFNLVPKTYKVTAVCEGVSGEGKVVINKASSKVTAPSKTFKKDTKTKKYSVVLKSKKGKAVKNADVRLTVNGKTYKAKTNASGKAVFSLTRLEKKGTYTVTVKFKGNSYYKSTSKKGTIKIK